MDNEMTVPAAEAVTPAEPTPVEDAGGILTPTAGEPGSDVPQPDPSGPQPIGPDTPMTDAEVLELLPDGEAAPTANEAEELRMLAVLEAIVYVTDEPLTAQQIAAGLNQPLPDVRRLLTRLTEEYNKPEHGLTVREVAGGYKMATKT